MGVLSVGVMLALSAGVRIDEGVRRLCDDSLAPQPLCDILTACGPVSAGACASDDPLASPETDARSWRCEIDRKHGYLTCSELTVLAEGPGAGDLIEDRWDAALFVGKSARLIAIVHRGDRPEAFFFSDAGHRWDTASPLPSMSAEAFSLPKPSDPGDPEKPWFQPKFFFELTLPKVGTDVEVEARWVDTSRDDSGYGQTDSLLSREVRKLTWDRARAAFRWVP